MAEVIIHREQVYDPYRGEFVYKLSQTHSVKRCRSTAGGAGTVANVATYSIGYGSVAKMTYLHITAGPTALGAAGCAINLTDRYGTYDRVFLTHGTNEALTMAGASDYVQQGGPDAPLHTLYGTIRFHKGAIVIGTVSVAYELVISSGMPYREGTVTRY